MNKMFIVIVTLLLFMLRYALNQRCYEYVVVEIPILDLKFAIKVV